jgi:Spy/CpxP family protein refolding chaperone
MKPNILLILKCASIVLVSSTRADEPADPLVDRLFPPDLILHNGEAIGLSDEKRQEIMSRVEKAQARFQELEQALRKERDAMVVLLDREKPDETALLKQLDALIAREREMKRGQFGLMLSLRNLLSTEQQTRLKELRKTHSPSAIEARLKEKLSRVEAGVQKLASNGSDPSSITEKMQQFPELMRTGKVKEAEALLDRVVKELEAK